MQASRVVVVTGASAGVGREVAKAFARRGARVGLVARGRVRLEALAEAIAAEGGVAFPVSADVADAAQLDAAASAIEARLGTIDTWVNNAAATVFSPLSEMTPAEFRRVTDVCYMGYVHGTMAALTRMRPRGHGRIVQVSSAVAFRGVPLQTAYSGAKHAVLGFTNALRAELIAEGLAVGLTLVHLPAVNTPHYHWAGNRTGRRAAPMPPFIEAAEAAAGILQAADAGRREVWIGRQTIEAMLMNTLAPEALDHYLAGRCYAGEAIDDAAGSGNLWDAREEALDDGEAPPPSWHPLKPLDVLSVSAPAMPPAAVFLAGWLGARWPWR